MNFHLSQWQDPGSVQQLIAFKGDFALPAMKDGTCEKHRGGGEKTQEVVVRLWYKLRWWNYVKWDEIFLFLF